jgi:DNA-binding HxlR family transcriptional regulator
LIARYNEDGVEIGSWFDTLRQVSAITFSLSKNAEGQEIKSQAVNDLRRTLEGISARVLKSELKDLEMNGFIKRNLFTGTPVVVEYELTEYTHRLQDVMRTLSEWGTTHRETIKKGYKAAMQGKN